MSIIAISALVRRRRELTCCMNMLAEEHAGPSDELAALDRVLESFAPDMDIKAISPHFASLAVLPGQRKGK